MEISKQLLSRVLEDDEISTWDYEIEIDKDLILFCGGHRSVDIYKLLHKCKEWLFKNKIDYAIYRTDICMFYSEKYHLEVCAETELKAVIKACEWILSKITLENKKRK